MALELLKKRWKLIVGAVVLVAAVFGGWYLLSNQQTTTAQAAMVRARRGTIEVNVSANGTAAPLDTRSVTGKVGGTITSVNFKDGQRVKKGDLLFELDSSTLKADIEKAKLDLQQLQLDQGTTVDQRNQQQVLAPISGQVSTIEVAEGADVQKNAVIMIVEDHSKLSFEAPFNGNQINSINNGQKVDVTIPSLMATVSGKVSKVDRVGTINADGSTYYYVTVEVSNPGALTTGTQAQASIHTASGVEQGLEPGTMDWANAVAVRAGVAGTIQNITVEQNDFVRKGQRIASLDIDNINTQLQGQDIKIEQARLSLVALEKQLADYKIYAPIDGVVNMSVTQSSSSGSGSGSSNGNSGSSSSASTSGKTEWLPGDEIKAGETVATMDGTQGMGVVVPVDEVDIAKVKIGQQASITMDALPDQTFSGIVTDIGNEGQVQSGVASFDVTITIEKPVGIRPGMTANVEIKVNRKENALLVPIEAVLERQGKKFVEVVTGVPNTDQAGNRQWVQGDQQGSGQEGQQGNGQQGDRQANSDNNPQWGQQNGSQGSQNGNSNTRTIPVGQGKMQEVQTGLYNESVIEITSGLKDGDRVILPTVVRSTNSNNRGLFGGGGGGGGNRGGMELH